MNWPAIFSFGVAALATVVTKPAAQHACARVEAPAAHGLQPTTSNTLKVLVHHSHAIAMHQEQSSPWQILAWQLLACLELSSFSLRL